jgi:hypothetical protein
MFRDPVLPIRSAVHSFVVRCLACTGTAPHPCGDRAGRQAAGMRTGVVHLDTLRAAGMSRRELNRLVRNGNLVRIRTGWYAGPAPDADVVRAVSLGGRVTCVDALRRHRVWVLPDPRLHVAFARSQSRLPTAPTDVRRHFGPDGRQSTADAVVSVAEALRHYERCTDEEGLVMALDSALNQQLLLSSDLPAIFGERHGRIGELVDGRSESGTETRLRLWLCRRGHHVQVQHHLSGIGRTDLLVNGWLVLELDSRAWHTGIEAYERDRARDLAALGLAHPTLRLTYRQVFEDWPETQRRLADVLLGGRRSKLIRLPGTW